MASSAELVLTRDAARPADEILRAPVSVLLGVTPAAQSALSSLDIRTVFDLAASRVFATASRLRDAERNPASVDARLGTAPAEEVARPDGVALTALASQSIAILKRIGAARAAAVTAALDTSTVRDLALWPPYRAAQEILAEAFFPDRQTGFDASSPDDLLPQTRTYPTERVFYKKLLIDAAPASLEGLTPIEQSDSIDVLPGLLAPTGFQRLATGALLTYGQSWFSQGLTLGQLLHSTALAPGESTRLAVVDWTRRTRATASEDITEAEQLANISDHYRALNEVTSATAREFQQGISSTTSTSSTGQSGTGFGIDIGPLAFGGSSSGSRTTTEAMSATSSFGTRDVAAQFAQSINDRSQQNASSVRNRRASIVREVSQEEHETISTRVVTNYNHMHALSVQYYEVVQAFRVTTQLERAERCLFVPLKLLDFRDPATVERSRFQLASAALTPAVAKQLAEFGTVKLTSELPLRPLRMRVGAGLKLAAAATAVTTTATTGESPTAPSGSVSSASAEQPPAAKTAYRQPATRIAQMAAAGWNLTQLEQLGRAGGRLFVPSRPSSVYVPEDALVIGFSLREGQAGQQVVRRQDGSAVAFNDRTPTTVGFAAPVPVAELQTIALQNAEVQERPTALVLQLSVFGTLTTLDVPIHLKSGGEGSALQTCVTFDAGRSMRDLMDHLEANKLYYSQVVFRTLDGPAVAALLARFTFRGLPLAQLVDQQPVAVCANFLVFKTNMPSTGDADDPRLADDLAAWRTFLVRTGLDRPVPRTDVIPLPSGGVFAEAVLGRFNAAERLELERFWNWQDSPIPIVPSEIAAVGAGSRAQTENLLPGQLSSPVVSIQAPTALPDPTGVAAVVTALQNANLFRDMSGLAQTAALAQTAQQVTAAGATAAEQQAGQNLFTVMDQQTQRMRIAAQLAAQMAGIPVTGSTGGSTPPGKNTLTERGGELNEAGHLDARKRAGESPNVEESTFRTQQGTKTRDLANTLVQATGAPPSDAASPPASTPTRGVGPKQPLPHTVSVALNLSSSFADPSIFGPVPVEIHAFIREPGGKQIWEQTGTAAPTFSGPLNTAETHLDLQVGYQYQLSWPGPTPRGAEDIRTLGLTVAPDAPSLKVNVVLMLDTKTVTIADATPPADDAALAAVLRAEGVDLAHVLAKPTVAPHAGGGFDVTFRLLRTVGIEQL